MGFIGCLSAGWSSEAAWDIPLTNPAPWCTSTIMFLPGARAPLPERHMADWPSLKGCLIWGSDQMIISCLFMFYICLYCFIISSSWHDWHVDYRFGFRSPGVLLSTWMRPLVGLPIGCNLRRKLQEATAYCSQSGYENLRLLGSAVGGWFTPSFLGASFEHQPHQPHFFGLGTSINPWNHPKLLVTFRFVAKSLLIGVPVVYTFGAFLAAAFVQVMPSFSRTWLHRRSHTSSRPEMSCQLDDDVTSRKPRSEPPKKCSMLLEFPLFC